MVEKAHQFKPNNFKVADFLEWQRQGSLDLNPEFQRRSVWKPGAKSYLIDTVHRGLPVPLIFLRDRLDLAAGKNIREVVDGQQRLRTLLTYIDPESVADFDEDRDSFVVSKTHNLGIAGRTFKELPDVDRARILSYEISVQTLPDSFDDKEVLGVFARLNSTGQTLNPQELRNAAYFGELKTTMYDLAYEQIETWLRWGIYTPDQVSRMAEVELVSDLTNNILYGLSSKSQPRLNRLYQRHDSVFKAKENVVREIRRVMQTIDDNYSDQIRRSIFSSEVQFFTLFVYTYDVMFDLMGKSFLDEARPLPSGYRRGLIEASRRFKELEVPVHVLDAVTRASADIGRRRTRLEFLRAVVDEASPERQPT